MGEWSQEALGDLLEVIIDHRGKTPKKMGGIDFTSSGVPVVSAIHIKGGRINWEERERYVPQWMFEKWMPVRLRRGDVLLTSEAPLGEVAQVPSDEDLVLSQRLFALRGRPDRLDSSFLRYFLESREGRERLLVRASGTTVVGIRQAELVKVPVPVPPIDEQRRIAAVLGALDATIDTNRRLAQTSCTLVSAGFARQFSRRALALPVGEIADVVDCLHSKKPERILEGSNILVQLNNIRDNGLYDARPRYLIDDADFALWSRKFTTRAWDCVITNVGRIGAVSRIPAGVSAAIGRNMTGLRPIAPDRDGAFLVAALLSSGVREEIEARTDSGTVMNSLNVRSIPLLRLPYAEKNEREDFQVWAGPLLTAADECEAEANHLLDARDQLLPLLMSGKVRVEDVEGAA